MSSGVTVAGFPRRRVKVEVVVADVTTSVVASGRLVVPPPKPDIASILDTQAQVAISQVSVVPGAVVVQGNVNVNILYVSTAPSQPVHAFEGTLSLFGSASVPGVFSGMIPEVLVTSVFATSRLVDPRTVEVNVLVSLRVRVLREEISEVVVEAPPTIVVPTVTVPVTPVVRRRVVTVERAVLQGESETVAAGTISIPPDKPGASQIIRTDAAASVTATQVLQNKVVVNGAVSVRVLYVAVSPGQPVFSVDGALSFSAIVRLPGVQPGMFAFASVQVEAADAEIVNARTLRVRVVLRVSVVVTVDKDLTLVTAVENLPEPLVAVTRVFLVEEIVGQVEDTSTIPVRIVVPAELPAVGRVIQSFAQARVTRTTVLDGVVLVEGTLRITVLYSELPSQRVFATVETVPFSLTLRVLGAIPAYYAVCDVDVTRVVAVPVEPRFVNVRVGLRGWTMVTRIDTVSAVVGVSDKTAGAGGQVSTSGRVHVVQVGETLYQIAKRYGTTVAAIVQANAIPDPDRIEIGDTLVIP
ncbi:MAG: SPOCS domain-containing protein [Betaproteobacteria bacterium]